MTEIDLQIIELFRQLSSEQKRLFINLLKSIPLEEHEREPSDSE